MYYAKVTWYDEYHDKEEVTHMLLPVASYSEACKEIDRCFKWVRSVYIELLYEFNENDIKAVYIPADAVESVKKENTF